jgi:hypothetical protein
MTTANQLANIAYTLRDELIDLAVEANLESAVAEQANEKGLTLWRDILADPAYDLHSYALQPFEQSVVVIEGDLDDIADYLRRQLEEGE